MHLIGSLELAEARSLLETIANSTEHADAAQKWECEKAELLNAIHALLPLAGRSVISYANVQAVERAQTLIAKYEAK
jgi:hypothetical protein